VRSNSICLLKNPVLIARAGFFFAFVVYNDIAELA